MRSRFLALGFVALVIAIVIAVATRQADTPGVLRLAYQNRIASALVIVAVDQGFFSKEGLSIESHRFQSGPACSEALLSGSADIGTAGDTTAIITAARGDAYTIIASHGTGEHRHRIVVRGDSAIQNPADLVGRRIGVKKGTSTFGGLLAFLSHHHLRPEQLTIIDVRPEDMPEALAAGSIDAFVASEPTPSLAETQGARELATLGGLGNTYPITIVAKSTLLAEQPETARRFLRALRRAEIFVRDHPDRTVSIVAEATGLPPDVTRRAMQRHTYELSLDDGIIASLKQTADFLQSQGIIQAIPDLESAAAREYLASLRAS